METDIWKTIQARKRVLYSDPGAAQPLVWQLTSAFTQHLWILQVTPTLAMILEWHLKKTQPIVFMNYNQTKKENWVHLIHFPWNLEKRNWEPGSEEDQAEYVVFGD